MVSKSSQHPFFVNRFAGKRTRAPKLSTHPQKITSNGCLIQSSRPSMRVSNNPLPPQFTWYPFIQLGKYTRWGVHEFTSNSHTRDTDAGTTSMLQDTARGEQEAHLMRPFRRVWSKMWVRVAPVTRFKSASSSGYTLSLTCRDTQS